MALPPPLAEPSSTINGGASDGRPALATQVPVRSRRPLGRGAAHTRGPRGPPWPQAPDARGRQVRRGSPLGRSHAPGDHAVDAPLRGGGHGHRGGPGGSRPRVPQGRGPGAGQDHRRRSPLREGAGDRPRSLRAVLLPLRHARRGQSGRALQDGAAARLPPARAVRLLLLPGLHVRLLQRARPARRGGRGLRGEPGRLHLRRGLLRPRRETACAPTRSASRSPSTSTAPSTRSIAATPTCGACTPASR